MHNTAFRSFKANWHWWFPLFIFFSVHKYHMQFLFFLCNYKVDYHFYFFFFWFFDTPICYMMDRQRTFFEIWFHEYKTKICFRLLSLDLFVIVFLIETGKLVLLQKGLFKPKILFLLVYHTVVYKSIQGRP